MLAIPYLSLKEDELLPSSAEDHIWCDFEHIEANSLAQRSALSNGDDIAFSDSEGRGKMSRDVCVTLFEAVVFADVVQVVTSHDDRAVHLAADHHAPEDATSDANVAGERALSINELAVDSFIGSLEA
eukprot:CAMPEP_0204902190 /NCGR_PEP_ID=MMETSP1397-20131031/3511_1 /ASSEMBLY_ACC=CAM_ASM_000891 /TAXON_ID=49980 /ORGANISM="Climacostomum Climacostomum virens, Strain Stock W-24" /LENGTH=127 /DNA_ID=CAMNT_0052070649 /DNA_START=817 /DNA_END=1200 /DNA_ORIENTATION=-